MFRVTEVLSGILVALNVLGFNAVFVSYGVCNTPLRLQGHCVPLSECPSLYKLVTSDNVINNIEFLRQSQCGLDTNATMTVDKIRVCCSDYPSTESSENDSSKMLPLPGDCGITFNTRILGGIDTQIGEYPWLALLKYQRPYNATALSCAGVLINQRYVLTAAHCVHNADLPDSWKLDSIRLGEWNISSNPDCIQAADDHKECADPYIEIKIERIIVNNEYIPYSRSQFHDIALIRMVKNVNYTDSIRPICLPNTNQLRQMTFGDQYADIAGWGQTEISSNNKIKKKISLRIWKTNECVEKFQTIGMTLDSTVQLCAGGESMIDTCRGDSGAPLIMHSRYINQPYFVIGIVSAGLHPCGTESWPGIYTRVTYYIDWIIKNLEN